MFTVLSLLNQVFFVYRQFHHTRLNFCLQIERVDVDMEIRRCVFCGKTFETIVNNKKSCSVECGQAITKKRAEEAREKNLPYFKRKCLKCGEEFKTRRVHETFCGSRCREEHHNELYLERWANSQLQNRNEGRRLSVSGLFKV